MHDTTLLQAFNKPSKAFKGHVECRTLSKCLQRTFMGFVEGLQNAFKGLQRAYG
jgi:hypothetical protein